MSPRYAVAVAAASLLLAAAPAAFADAPSPPPGPSIHCDLTTGATITVNTPTGAVKVAIPVGARLSGHGAVSGTSVLVEDVDANASPPPLMPPGPGLHGSLAAADDLSGDGCTGVILPAGAQVTVNGGWMGTVFVVHNIDFHAAPPAPPAIQTVLSTQATLVILTAEGQRTITLPAGTQINGGESSELGLTAVGGMEGVYLLKLRPNVMLELVGVGPTSATLVLPAKLTLKAVAGSSVATVTSLPPAPTTGTETVTIMAVVPPTTGSTSSTTGAGLQGSGAPGVPTGQTTPTTSTPPPSPNVAATSSPGSTPAASGAGLQGSGAPGVPASNTTTTSSTSSPPGSTVASSGYTPPSTTTPTTSTPAPSAKVSSSTSTTPSTTTTTTPPSSKVAAASSSASNLPKTGSSPLGLPLGMALIAGGLALVGLPWLRRRSKA